MKRHLLLAAFLFRVLTVSFGQTKVPIEDAGKHIGETVTICSKVYSARYLSSSNGTPTLINLGAAYPNELLTVVIYGTEREKFAVKPEEAW